MSDDNVLTITAQFDTRAAADRAIEYLVQEHEIDRSDIFVQAIGDENSAGEEPSGADASETGDEGSDGEPALKGAIEVSADISRSDREKAEDAFKEAGATVIRVQ